MYALKKASISFAFPTYFDIHITERLPGLYVECDGPQFAKVSYSGHVLAVHSSIPDATAPLLTGYHGGNLMEGDEIEDEDVRGLLQFLGRLEPSIQDQITEVSMDGRKQITIHLRRSLPIIVWRCGKCQQKDRCLCDALPGNGEPEIKGKYIDITYEQPYVKLE